LALPPPPPHPAQRNMLRQLMALTEMGCTARSTEYVLMTLHRFLGEKVPTSETVAEHMYTKAHVPGVLVRLLVECGRYRSSSKELASPSIREDAMSFDTPSAASAEPLTTPLTPSTPHEPSDDALNAHPLATTPCRLVRLPTSAETTILLRTETLVLNAIAKLLADQGNMVGKLKDKLRDRGGLKALIMLLRSSLDRRRSGVSPVGGACCGRAVVPTWSASPVRESFDGLLVADSQRTCALNRWAGAEQDRDFHCDHAQYVCGDALRGGVAHRTQGWHAGS
jgi:hypothetical protein